MPSSRTVTWRRPSRPHGEDGAAAVEFALVLIPFLIVVFGLIQYGFYFFAAQAGSSAANSALRQLAVGNCQDSTKLATYVNSRIQGAAEGTATITTNYYDTTGALVTNTPVAQNVPVGGTVKLTITFAPINLKLPLVPFMTNAQVKREVPARVEDNTDEGCGV
jgi:Flp pilus assembly protein TadG